MKKRKSLMIPAILLLCLFFISGCGEGVPAGTLNTTGATVTLTNDAGGSLPAGQSCILTAVLQDNTQTCDKTTGVCTSAPRPLPGQVITFSLWVDESGAVLTTADGGRTDAAGKATATYTAGYLQPGLTVQDIVRANIKDYSGLSRITRKGGGTSGFALDLPTVPALNTKASTTITVTVTDSTGTAGTVGSGVQVAFDLYENKSGATLSVFNAITDAGGMVSTVYTAGATGGGVQDIIRVRVTGAIGYVIITVN
jgi:hypothetical protein